MKTRMLVFVLAPRVLRLAFAGFNILPVGAVGPGLSAEAPFGIEQRVPWTASRISGSPDPPAPFVTRRVFPKLKFKEPVEFCRAPGTDRLFVAELKSKVYSFPNRADVETPDLFLDLSQFTKDYKETYGMVFHPGFATNRYVYVCYVLKDGLPDGTRVSRFTVTPTDPPRAEPASERVIITWLSGGHNGGCLHFGPDGCLYISTGDGVGPNPPDTRNTGQDISDLLSSILRIDVDHAEPGKTYRVPPDNPFANLPGARPEVWAYGFRNPWKMSFDSKTGSLWAGDVGWELWEMVYRVERGGNYGWSVVEGPQVVKPDGKRGPTPILPPTVQHPHSEAASITGGYFYYGRRLKELVGAYIYGDWETGKIWALRHDGRKVTSLRELCDTPFRVICFGLDNASELYVVDYDGAIHQLEPNPQRKEHTKFPTKLSETGLFTSVKNHTVAPGVVPCSPNAELWNDGASAERFVALHETSLIRVTKEKWLFPTNTVLAKTLSLETERGQAGSRRRVETQVLHFDGLDWHAYTYQWNREQTDALLVGAAGGEQTLEIMDRDAPAGRRKQTWRFHSRAECLRCHNPRSGPALAFNELQLNKDHCYGAVTDNQLRTLAHIGIINTNLSGAPAKLSSPYDPAVSLNDRARSWLHVNCGHCHRLHAGGSVLAYMHYDLKPDQMRLTAAPLQGNCGIEGARIVAPGDPFHSTLIYRVCTTGPGRMPHIGSREVDVAGTKLLHDWIKQLPKEYISKETNVATVVASNLVSDSALQQLSNCDQLSAKERSELFERLLSSPSGALALVHELDTKASGGSWRTEAVERAAVQPNAPVRDLFERFLPEEKRVKRLGPAFKPEQVLSLKGNTANGRKIFFLEGGSQCAQCHLINGQGRDLGPDLSHIGKKYSRAQLLEQILAPSKVIDPAFVSYLVETKDGLAYSGFVLKRTDAEIVLKDATLNPVRLSAANVARMQPQQVSTMPEGLLQSLTAQEAADLLAYLTSLR
jgi:putative heme-binding domain-containing protein